MTASRRVQVVGSLAALAVVASLAVLRWDEFRIAVQIGGIRIPLATALVVGGLLGGAKSWSVLLPIDNRRSAFRAYLIAQPAKYLPIGGLLQGVSQVGLSSATTEPRSAHGLSWLAHALVQVGVAGTLGVLLIAQGADVGRFVVAACSVLVGVGVSLATHGSVVGRIVVRTGGRVRSRWFDWVRGQWPSPSRLRTAWMWSLLPFLLSGSALAMLVPGMSVTAIPVLVGAFGIAWVVGFVALPFPSGAGVRELVLVLLLDWVPPGAVVAASLMHRVSTFLAEAVLLGVTLLLARPVDLGERMPS